MRVEPDDQDFAALIRRLSRELDPPPPAPREAMWQAIAARRAAAPAVPGQRAPGPVGRAWRARAAPTFAAAAASLVLGIAIGRGWTGAPGPGSAGPAAAVAETRIPLAALDHLARSEALLVSFEVGARTGVAADVAAWAQDLLLTTRLLAESAGAGDPQLAALLDDLELILAQIAALGAGVRDGEIDLIQDGLQTTDVLGRLRAVTAAAPPGL
jgi:hypothetical protein